MAQNRNGFFYTISKTEVSTSLTAFAASNTFFELEAENVWHTEIASQSTKNKRAFRPRNRKVIRKLKKNLYRFKIIKFLQLRSRITEEKKNILYKIFKYCPDNFPKRMVLYSLLILKLLLKMKKQRRKKFRFIRHLKRLRKKQSYRNLLYKGKPIIFEKKISPEIEACLNFKLLYCFNLTYDKKDLETPSLRPRVLQSGRRGAPRILIN